jgi:dipeptidyl aminopeptidase/acylaminoacyl peptidase
MGPGAGGGSTVAPYGSWRSPFPIDWLTHGTVRPLELDADGDGLVWLEVRPEEGGGQVLVRRAADGTTVDFGPAGVNVRTRVHEYGGASYLVRGGHAVASDFSTGRLLRRDADGAWRPLTPQRAWRYADLELDESRRRLIAILEDHEPATLERHGEAENALVAVSLVDGDVTVLASGRDFYAAPRLSPDGRHLAWLEWSHPNMPWDGTELMLAPVAADGTLGDPVRIAGDPSTWVAQPAWAPDGSLWFAAEPEEWMSLHRWRDGRIEPMTTLPAEFAGPDWQLGYRTYVPLADGTAVAIGRSSGRDRLYVVGPQPGSIREVATPFTELDRPVVQGGSVVAIAATPTDALAIVRISLSDGASEVLRASSGHELAPDDVSVGTPVEFPTTDGRTAFGIFYAPRNAHHRGPDGDRPPLIVTSHGGPTSAASTARSLTVQAFTTRGIAVLDVDYGGSTGYGRSYRERLEGQWGIVDVDDCVAGARRLAERGLVDAERVVVRGGSASGFTTLAALAFRDVFAGGITYFGIGDLRGFAMDTHKFESRYLDRLIGPWPDASDLYATRSPGLHADGMRSPVLVLQGEEDRVVPPSEAERIVAALRRNGIPHAYLLFPGEDHGFRQATSIRRAFEAELSFLGQVLGFQPADEVAPIELVRA